MGFRGNKKYAKREPKKLIRVVALKIENHTTEPLVLNENLWLYSGKNPIQPLEPAMVHKELKQGVPIYLLYSLLWITKNECEGNNCETTMVLPVGIPIAIGNMIVAGSSNKQFKEELERFALTSKPIEPGQTAYAIVGIADNGFLPLSVRVKQ